MISHSEIEKFWYSLARNIESWQAEVTSTQNWALIPDIQAIASAITRARACDLSTLPYIAGIAKNLARLAGSLDGAIEFHAFAERCQRLFAHEPPNNSDRHTELARRLYSIHRFLDGRAGAEQYGSIQTDMNEDIQYGLGLGLRDGSMLRFLTQLKEQDNSPICRSFDEESIELIDAIEGGQTSLEQFFNSQMILRYDPVMSRKKYELSDSLRSHFSRLGAEPTARKVQVDILAGNRFRTARKVADESGIRSLRGFAMLFDLDNLANASITEQIGNVNGEASKCLSLADEVIARMHGHIAVHWQNRLESVFHGMGNVDGRFYDERRFLGKTAEGVNWENADYLPDDEMVSQEPVPGRTYVVSPGDRLSVLTEKAYHGEGDYRYVLRQNPHIQHPESLIPGTRLYFPELNHTAPVNQDIQPINEITETETSIQYAGREIHEIAPMTVQQRHKFIETLKRLSSYQLYHAEKIEIPSGLAIVCCGMTLLISEQENRHRAAGLYPDSADPVGLWLDELAGQIRGDLKVKDNLRVPLSTLPEQPHRHDWIRTSVRRMLSDEHAYPPRVIIHARNRCVDIADACGETVLRLENEDFSAIRNQPKRRLSDYVAPPVIQMNVLSQLWLCDLLGESCEICVPPLAQANQYVQDSPEEECQFLVPIGTSVYPIMSGTVIDCGRFPGIGFGVLIRHHAGLYSRYACLATVCVHPGQTVTAETMIGRTGCSEQTGEPVLRLKLKYSEKKVVDWLSFGGEAISYLDVVCHPWPTRLPFDSFMME
ncbi:MAG: M23 family metallopeptidase [Proteobacteria bacterium]|nr:M23 family metallopeptidase [Pseudomonadota bacterium]